jgi:carboxyl-terminal processing protease
MRGWRWLVVGLVLALLLAGVFASGYWLGNHRVANAQDDAGFDVLWNVRAILDRSFIGEIPTAQQQAYGAAHGLVAAFDDPYTVFVEPAPREMERDELAGHFGGIGAYMTRNDADDLVLTVIPDRPAAKAGIQDGDVLLEVDGKPVTPEMKVDEVVALVRGEIGTKVALKLRRPGQAEPLAIAVVRERIETPSVEWRVLDKDKHIGYARIHLFGQRTSQELQDGLADLASQGVDKLVLDLRGNGGGLVDAAIDIDSQFIKDGQVLREVKRGGQERFYPTKNVKGPAQTWELALLVDGGTASASEIVAGSLRDQKRAVLIGEKTYGKGSVQEVHELADGSSLHVTVARWLTPNRVQIDKTGLAPDIVIGISEDDRNAGRDPQLTRAQSWLGGERSGD